jgi:hypothetical protein
MRLVTILNQEFELPAQLNAVGHLCVGAHKLIDPSELAMRCFQDRTGNLASVLTDLPLIVLEAESTGILLETHMTAIAKHIPAAGFFDCMRSGSPEAQHEMVGSTRLSDQIYIGLLLLGSKETLKPLTRRFSLHKGG